MATINKQSIVQAMSNLVPLMTYAIMSEDQDKDEAFKKARAELISTLGIEDKPAFKVIVKEGNNETSYEIPANSLPNLPANFPESFNLSAQEVSIEMPYGKSEDLAFNKREARRLADALGENKKINSQQVGLEDDPVKMKLIGNKSIINLAAFDIDKVKGVPVQPKKRADYDTVPPPSKPSVVSSAPPPLPTVSSAPPPPSSQPPSTKRFVDVVPPPHKPYTSDLRPPLPSVPPPSKNPPPPPPPGKPPAHEHAEKVTQERDESPKEPVKSR